MSILEKIPALTLGLLTWWVSSKAVAAAGFACQASWEQENSWLYLEDTRSACLAANAGPFRAACSNLSLFYFLQGNRR